MPGALTSAGYRVRHLVGFEETNVVGNAYYANYFVWQANCLSDFVSERSPDVVSELRAGHTFATLNCRIDFIAESFLLDEIEIRMSVAEVVQNRIRLRLEYMRNEALVARGEQEAAFVRREGGLLLPARIPAGLRDALRSIATAETGTGPLSFGQRVDRFALADLPVHVYRHVVAFEETDHVGRVSHVKQILWQGRCRELVFAERAPELVGELEQGLALATVSCSWEGFGELSVFDHVNVEMYCERIVDNRMTLAFRYLRVSPDGNEELIARGSQEVASLQRTPDGVKPATLPAAMRKLAELYAPEFAERGIDIATAFDVAHRVSAR